MTPISHDSILGALLTNKRTWKMRPPELSKKDVLNARDRIISDPELWVDLNAHNIVNLSDIDTLADTDPSAFEHAITNFWLAVWLILNDTNSP